MLPVLWFPPHNSTWNREHSGNYLGRSLALLSQNIKPCSETDLMFHWASKGLARQDEEEAGAAGRGHAGFAGLGKGRGWDETFPIVMSSAHLAVIPVHSPARGP